jgi:hypothetical protein
MKKLLLICTIFLLASTFFSQSNNDESKSDVRVKANKPTVYLEYVCQDEKKISLRMYNNTVWHIGVDAEKSYFPTKKPIKLGNGNKGYAIPNDEEVPIHYYIEKDELGNVKKIKVPKKERYYWSNGGGRIAIGDFIYFTVPIEHLHEGLKIYVEFIYEWEISKSGDTSKEPEHRVYFRGGDIGSANTGIEAKPCKN